MTAETRLDQEAPAARMSLREVLEHAQALRRGGQYDDCEALCRHILEQIPEQPNARHLMAILQHQQGRTAQAIEQMEQLAGQLPDDPGIRLDLANLLIDDAQFEAGAGHLQHALALDPQSTPAWNSLATACLGSDRLEDAEAALTSGLAIEPERDDLLNNLALLRGRQGRSDEAIELLIGAAERASDQPERWTRLAEALAQVGRWSEAADAWQCRLAVGAATPALCKELGLALLRCDRLDDSEAAFRRGLELDPHAVELHHHLARALHRGGRHRESIEHCRTVLAVEPVSGPLRRMMSQSYLALGEREAAVDVLRRWHVLEPRDPEPARLLAEIGAETAPVRAVDEPAPHVADDPAGKADSPRGLSSERASELVAAALASVASRLPSEPEILDAGCGSGSCAVLLRPLAGRLVGLELASSMRTRAAARAVYDVLERDELTAFLLHSPRQFDAIVVADALCGIGDLREMLAAAAGALHPRGVLVFALEALDGDAQAHVLQESGRHAHSRAYVRSVLQASGFGPTLIAADTLREEPHGRVPGWVVTALRADAG